MAKKGAEIFEALRDKDEGDEVFISKEDMEQLVQVLGIISGGLRSGAIWFNKPGPKNKEFACFCESMARKFSNIKIHQES